ncbi:MAG: PA0069 family radical SAM protein [Bacteroidota bacterium]|nr:PA0069 family radical SAM protein [Bacteroidota bacterium]MDP4233689.1 PA0069 family radical SAM protein [Bacteroidota bacterium]MDP4241854.1 PA0069 family radical SAM protein [Bacteroidota bacterium]MDP4288958.1 PA0069 family radical SAM protein [Bacteroidota bacterium]
MHRGTELRTPNRFERTSLEAFEDGWEAPELRELPVIQTEFLPDHTKSILAKNDSPDVGFQYSINAYRGCEHGCAYCYARPTHEYLGFNAGIDFESKIMVKHDAAELLRSAFDRPSWKPQVVLMSGNTDCYQPAERIYGITRQLLEVFLAYRNPVGIISKNALVLRDLDLLSELACMNLVSVHHSVTTLDRALARKLEPRTSTPERRLASMRALTDAGVPTGVMIGPVIPGLNDEEIPAILQAARDAGASSAGYNMVRLPYSVKPIFEEWLDRNVPMEAKKVRARIEMVRDGRMNDPDFGSRMRGTGAYADYIKDVFKKTCTRLGLNQDHAELTTEHFRRPGEMTLFD